MPGRRIRTRVYHRGSSEPPGRSWAGVAPVEANRSSDPRPSSRYAATIGEGCYVGAEAVVGKEAILAPRRVVTPWNVWGTMS